MNKALPVLIIGASLSLLISAGAAVWMVRESINDAPKFNAVETDFDAMCLRLGVDADWGRQELALMLGSNRAKVSTDDQTKIEALPREVNDYKKLMEVAHANEFAKTAGVVDAAAYHFVSEGQRKHFTMAFTAFPKPERVLQARKELSPLSELFYQLRLKPDWNIEIESKDEKEITKLPMIEFIASGFNLFAETKIIRLSGDGKFPAFSGIEGELLEQLEAYFNSPKAREAFPQNLFPKLYVDGRMAALPNFEPADREMVRKRIAHEKSNIHPTDPPEMVAEVKKIFDRLEDLLNAIEKVRK
jgi:hypothetical protein